MSGRAAAPVVAWTTIVFLAIPVALYWYGSARCEELGCLGPFLQALIHAVSIGPLLVIWLVTRRPRYAVLLAGVELGFTIAMFISEGQDFIPVAPLVALPVGLAAGWVAGIKLERWRSVSGSSPARSRSR